MMFEKKDHPEVKKLVNDGGDATDEVKAVQQARSKYDTVQPLTLRQILRIPDLYILSFVFCFAS